MRSASRFSGGGRSCFLGSHQGEPLSLSVPPFPVFSDFFGTPALGRQHFLQCRQLRLQDTRLDAQIRNCFCRCALSRALTLDPVLPRCALFSRVDAKEFCWIDGVAAIVRSSRRKPA